MLGSAGFLRFGRSLLVLAGLAGPLSAAAAAELTPDQENAAIVFAWNNAVFTLYHEIGHMFVDQYDIPVLSKEEDAVDNLATLMALDDYNTDDETLLIDAVDGWLKNKAAAGEVELGDSDFYDEHSLDAQRTFAMVCLMVGSDFAKFTEIATKTGLDKERQEGCASDYEQAKKSWDAVLADHATPNEGEPQLTVTYQDPSAETADAAAILQSNEVLETVAKKIEAAYTLPNPISFEGADCGEDNAYYSASQAKVTLCYELVKGYYDLYVADLQKQPQASTEEEATEDAAGEETDEATAGDDSSGDGEAAEDEDTETATDKAAQ